MKWRTVYFLCAVATIIVGLASRRYRELLPSFVGEYSGDTLWALMVFLLISALLVRHSLVHRVVIALMISLCVEISQLYHADWIDRLRNTTLGGLVLGFEFVWSDLVCYAVGIAFGAMGDYLLASIRCNHKQA